MSVPNASDIVISIVVPVFNEEPCIRNFIEDLRTAIAPYENMYETIIIDDGSTDGTFKILQEFQNDVTKIIKHSPNQGYGASLKAGINLARGRFVCIIDGDDSYVPHEIERLRQRIEGFDMIVGSRVNGEAARFPWYQRLAKGLVCSLFRIFFRKNVVDLNSGFRLIRTDMVRRFLPLLPDGFSFTSSITLIALMENIRFCYVPISYKKRSGASKVVILDFVLKFLASYWRIIRWKMRQRQGSRISQ